MHVESISVYLSGWLPIGLTPGYVAHGSRGSPDPQELLFWQLGGGGQRGSAHRECNSIGDPDHR